MTKTKLSERILNAVHALRGEPWPTVIEGPKITYTYPATQTIGAKTTYPLEFLDLQGPEVTNMEAWQDVAKRIGLELLGSGAIKIARDVDLRNGYLHYRGQVRVVMPGTDDGYRVDFSAVDELHNVEKEDDGHGQE